MSWGSMWIRIEMAPLDPEVLRIRIRIRIQDSQNGTVSKKEKNMSIQVKKIIDHFAERPDGFYLSMGVFNRCLISNL